MKQFFHERPWIWIVAGYLFLMSATIAMVAIAVKFAPQPVPLEQSRSSSKP